LGSLQRVLRSCAVDLAHVFLPSDCRICGGPLVAVGPVGVCEDCVARVGPDATQGQGLMCARCGDALGMPKTLGMEDARFAASMRECRMCRLAPPEFEKAVAYGDYDNEMREMLHLLKFSRQRGVAGHVLGERLAAAVMRLRGGAAEELVVVPVPLFAAREKERGYNQARLLAEAALKALRRDAPEWRLMLRADVLLRVRDTHPLYRLDSAERRRELVGAFELAAAKAGAVVGREVLLIDDIMTTGATTRACAGVLLRGGAAKVWVATAAKTQSEGARQVELLDAYEDSDEVALWSAAVRTRVIEPDIGRRKSF